MYPFGDWVWNSFWRREREEKHSRTRSLGTCGGRADWASFNCFRRELSSESVSLRAQKQVTRMISCLALSKVGIMVDW